MISNEYAAKQQGHREAVDAVLPRNGVERRHTPVAPRDEIADCIAKVNASQKAS